MKIGVMLGEVLRSLGKRPVTQQYPFERESAPQRLRGKLVWDPAKCAGCQLCVKDCPSQALDFIIVDKAQKRYVMRYHIDRCTFCGQCVENCRFDCLSMSNEAWELASTDRNAFDVYYGNPTDIQLVVAKNPERGSLEPSED